MLPYQPSSGEVDVVGRVWPPVASHREPVVFDERASGNVHAEVASSNVTRKVAHDFVVRTSEVCAKVYTDQADVYRGIPKRIESVNHSAGEDVRMRAHTQGIESHWAALRRAILACSTSFTEASSAV